VRQVRRDLQGCPEQPDPLVRSARLEFVDPLVRSARLEFVDPLVRPGRPGELLMPTSSSAIILVCLRPLRVRSLCRSLVTSFSPGLYWVSFNGNAVTSVNSGFDQPALQLYVNGSPTVPIVNGTLSIPDWSCFSSLFPLAGLAAMSWALSPLGVISKYNHRS
jgi:hypothetical protein